MRGEFARLFCMGLLRESFVGSRARAYILNIEMKIRQIVLVGLLSGALPLLAGVYEGRIVDETGQGVGYATVYPEANPVEGVATNNDGYFTFETDLPEESTVVISFIGYEKQSLPLMVFRKADFGSHSDQHSDSMAVASADSIAGRDGMQTADIQTIVLREQPIALEETVVAARASRQRNKRKEMAALLHAVYVQMASDFSDEPARYRVVSDVRMDSEGEAWGMEQMIASVVVLPEATRENKDSVQFAGEYCKRFFKPTIRALADTILAGDGLEQIDKNMRKAATAVDSGVVVHESLFALGNIRYDFEKWVGDVRHWSVSNESEGETVLTHTEKHNYFGIVKYTITRHYILDSETLSVRRFSEYAEGFINIPFGMKLDKNELQILNLFNMDDQQIEKFRLRKMHAQVHLNTIYQERDGHLYILEKNLRSEAEIIGTKKMEIPVQVSATQRVTSLQTEGVRALKRSEMPRRIERQIVEIY